LQQSTASLQTITRSALDQQHGIVLDTRDSAYFNGWPEAGATHGGHEPGAINFSASWVGKLDDVALSALVKAKALAADRPLALYGSAQQVDTVSIRLGKLGFKQLYRLDVSSTAAPRVALPRYHQLVPAFWLNDLIAGRSVSQAPAQGWKVMEVGWGEPERYLLNHIPGAGYLNTNSLESEPLWNTVTNDALKAALLEQGIDADTPVILYGRETIAAARAAHILLYAGVKDVRLLDGGWNAWRSAGYISVAGLPAQVQPLADFGSPFPGQPELMVSLPQARRGLKSRGERLVSIRSWQEFTGKTSGYSYIKAMGDIPGAAWGHAGSDANHMQDFRNPDHTMRSANEIAAIWRDVGIMPAQRVVFYCGTGWRASEAFFTAWVMGWQNISVFDGGWLEWSLDPANPIATGERPAKP
jgi:3-mercaptopyruvate sulfurtransferase SseA